MDLTYRVVRGVMAPSLRAGFRWQIEGATRIPPHGAAIVASNHTSYFDPLSLGLVAHQRHRSLRFLAKTELFEKKGVGAAFRSMKHVPVHRGTQHASHALDAAIEALRSGEIVGVFPEGTISIDLEPKPARTGTARLAQAASVPIVPVGLWGAHRVMTKGRKPNFRHRVTAMVIIGRPFRVRPEDDVRQASVRLMDEIADLVAIARERYPERPRPGEDDWWVRGPETVRVHLDEAGQAETASAG
ncbi:MAG: lysophospholipid acyltransferase family protein [Acidimicrobiia bacterium]